VAFSITLLGMIVLYLNLSPRMTEELRALYAKQVLPIMMLAGMLILTMLSFINWKDEERRKEYLTKFAFVSGIFFMNWLLGDKEILISVYDMIGWTLMGIVITLLKLFKSIAKK